MGSRTTFLATPEPGHAESAADEIQRLNTYRLYRLAIIFIFVHLAHVLLFWPYTPGATEPSLLWRNGVILAHAVMLVVAAGAALLIYGLERSGRMSRWAAGTITAAASLLYLLFGGTLAAVDQLVTSSLTPLLIASTGVAVTILIRPVLAAVNYLALLLFFNVAVGFTQFNPEQLLSARVNAITATGLGFGIALLQWRNQLRTVRQQQQIEEQKRQLEETNRELALLASQDELTGLSNRAQFVRTANRELARLNESRESACLIMMDIDRFKQINDTYGHPAGDSVLRTISQVLTTELGHLETLARWGGEEFAILLPSRRLSEGLQVAEGLRAAIAEHPFWAGAERIRVTASFGVAEFRPGHGDTLHTCYPVADRALYRAKAQGRNCVCSA